MTPDERDYSALWFRLGGQDRYLLWFSGAYSSDDGVWTRDGRTLMVWTSAQQVREFAPGAGLNWVKGTRTCHDLDLLDAYLRGGAILSANHALAAWNLFSHVARSIGDDSFLAEDLNKPALYNSVVGLSGLVGSRPQPLESGLPEEKLDELRAFLGRGLLMMRRALPQELGSGC